MTPDERLTEGLRSAGLHVERRQVAPFTHFLATAVGGRVGKLVGAAAGFGIVGQGVAALVGAITAHVVATHRLVPAPPLDDAASAV